VAGMVRRLGGGGLHRKQVVAVPGADDVDQVAGGEPGETHLDLALRSRGDHHPPRRPVMTARVHQELAPVHRDDRAGHPADPGPDALGHARAIGVCRGCPVPDDDRIATAQHGWRGASPEPGGGGRGDGEVLGAMPAFERDHVVTDLRDGPGEHRCGAGGPLRKAARITGVEDRGPQQSPPGIPGGIG
jgi:hypothetical protein